MDKKTTRFRGRVSNSHCMTLLTPYHNNQRAYGVCNMSWIIYKRITVRFVTVLSLGRDLNLTHLSAQWVMFENRHSNVVIVSLRVNDNSWYMNIYML